MQKKPETLANSFFSYTFTIKSLTEKKQITNLKNRTMRKFVLGAAMLLFTQFGFGQAIADQAVIPISVTLNSILRLTIISGGNIQFVVNTIDDYTNGIANSDRYTTTFSVASSRDFDVLLNAETANLLGTDDVANVLPVDNIGFVCPVAGTGGTFNATSVTPLDVAQFTLITARPAGGSTDNEFTVQWELATTALIGVNTTGATLLEQSLNPDNYVVNTFIVVDPN